MWFVPGNKVLDQVMKVFERVIEARLRNGVTIDNMQFGFSAGKGTVDARRVLRKEQGTVDGVCRSRKGV